MNCQTENFNHHPRRGKCSLCRLAVDRCVERVKNQCWRVTELKLQIIITKLLFDARSSRISFAHRLFTCSKISYLHHLSISPNYRLRIVRFTGTKNISVQYSKFDDFKIKIRKRLALLKDVQMIIGAMEPPPLYNRHPLREISSSKNKKDPRSNNQNYYQLLLAKLWESYFDPVTCLR
ncbi:hypothetical protein AGLY_014515 [Aphis glycines]|uniref:Uncharacterized protein n=1 Tax=Aphis glycines TaxID=307491 RepID=A0A6G0T5A9_APHGL|nr:hypothetical protein AGLY_014515 [Aphis glycines]